MKLQIENFIDGKFITPRNGTYLDNYNPATGEVITKIPNSDNEDVELAVKAAQKALPSWADLPRIKRVEWLRKIAKALELRKDDIAVTESMDTGKPISLAKRVDASRSIANFEFFAEHAEKLVDEEYEMTDAINTFMGEVPESYFEDGTWSLNSNSVPKQVYDLMRFFITLPEFQLK